MNLEQEIKKLISDFNGQLSLYASDGINDIKINENEIVEAASCIKVFILIEYYRQIMEKQKNRDDLLTYNYDNDYVKDGSGIIQYLDNNVSMTSKNMAILMIIVSDNIATNKMIDYLGYENINNTIKNLGLAKTKLVAKKLDFTIYNSIGVTTACEYAEIYRKILNKEILNETICEEIIDILSKQQKKDMLIKNICPKFLYEKGTDNGFIKYIASKSGGLGGEYKDIAVCRNDGGIFSTKDGDYIVSIFINDFSDYYFYNDNPAIILGSKISNLLFETFKKNNGVFIENNNKK